MSALFGADVAFCPNPDDCRLCPSESLGLRAARCERLLFLFRVGAAKALHVSVSSYGDGAALVGPHLAMKSKLLRTLLGSSVCLLATAFPVFAAYTWKSIAIGGGGYVTSLIVHPQDASLLYSRTDVGGAYRWDSTNQKWVQLLDEFELSPDYNVEGMCVEPSDTTKTKVYIATGYNTDGIVYRSASQGASGTWVDTGLPTGVELDGNGDYRWSGDRLIIDPHKPGRTYLGTRQDGVWVCSDINTSSIGTPKWSQIPLTQIPAGVGTGQTREGSNKIGITFIAFDQSGGTNGSGFTNRIYVGVFGNGVYKSTDGGTTWSAMAGSPTFPIQGRVDPTVNKLYVTHTTGVSKWNGTAWSNITPGGLTTEFAGLDINPNSPSTLVVAERAGTFGNDIYFSTDGGTTWSGTKLGTPTYTVPWWPTNWQASSLAGLRFAYSATTPNKVWFSDWYGTWRTNDISAASPAWSTVEQGHEELVMHTIRAVSPTGTNAAKIYTGAADVGGLRHGNLDAYPAAADKLTGNQDMNSIDVFEGDNNVVYRVGNTRANTTGGNGWRSGDGGTTWTAFDPGSDAVLPDTCRGGRIAISATSGNLVVWLPFDNRPYTSTDGGVNWTASSGITATNFFPNVWEPSQNLASNKATTNRFYIYKPDFGFWRSNTGSTAGASFSQVTGNGLPTFTSWSAGRRYGIRTVPGQDGGVWICLDDGVTGSGVYKSTDSGTTFTRLSNVKSAEFLAFGLKATGSSSPATVYMFGQLTADTQNWLYRSTDMGSTWTKINDTAHTFGSGVKALEGDRKTYGRVYVGTAGRGSFYGDGP